MFNKNPKVSIIIPVYNSGTYLRDTINSALNQTYQNIELIIVDDGSTDNSYSIAKEFESDNVKIFKQKNNGASSARNTGISNSNGDFIQFLDSDDLIYKTKIETQLNYIINNENCIIYCDTQSFFDVKEITFTKFDLNSLNIKEFEDPINFLLNLYGGFGKLDMIQPGAWLVPRQIIEKAGPWNEELTLDDDGEFFCRIVLNSKHVYHTPVVHNYYRRYKFEKSLSNFLTEKKLHSAINSQLLKKKYLLKYNDTIAGKKAIANQLMLWGVAAYPFFKNITKIALNEIDKLNVKPLVPKIGGIFIERMKSILGWKFTLRFKIFVNKLIK